jgi:hypothetical protein
MDYLPLQVGSPRGSGPDADKGFFQVNLHVCNFREQAHRLQNTVDTASTFEVLNFNQFLFHLPVNFIQRSVDQPVATMTAIAEAYDIGQPA